MFSQLFGEFLAKKNVITHEALIEILEQQSMTRVKLGTIAVAAGYLTEAQAEEINYLQTQQDKRFGDIALDKGYITVGQLSELLDQQGNAFMKFLQILTEKDCISLNELDGYLSEFQKSEGFSDEEMQALKKDDIDGIVPVFAFSAKPFVTELTALVLRNITRFVTTDFYIGRIHRVENYEYECLAGQKMIGDHQIYTAFGSSGELDGILALASGYAREAYTKLDSAVFDALGEFTNICSGLLATGLSEKGIDVDMESPFAYEKQQVEGTGYVVPIYLRGDKLELFISVDEDLTLGQVPYDMNIEKKAGSQVTADSKGTVVIVDDSALIRTALRNMIEEEGYTVVAEAANGEEAVEAYVEYRPDVITLDITMPVMDGVEALGNIMEEDSYAKAIMITAAGQQQKVIKALRKGAARFIMKPFNREEVLDALQEVIRSGKF